MQSKCGERLATINIMATVILTLSACNERPAEPSGESSAAAASKLDPVRQGGMTVMDAPAPLIDDEPSTAPPSAPQAAVKPKASGSDRSVIPRVSSAAPAQPALIHSPTDTGEMPSSDEHSGHDMKDMSDQDMPGM